MRSIFAIAVLALVGCSAVPSIPVHPQPQGAAIKASGGSFSASYSGTFTLRACAPPDGFGSFGFNGSGSGAFIHASTENGSAVGNVHGACSWSGTATLRNSLHPRNSVKVSLFLMGAGTGQDNTPCYPDFGHSVKFTVVSGTGRFTNATGSGTVAFTCHSDDTYTDKWSGTINF